MFGLIFFDFQVKEKTYEHLDNRIPAFFRLIIFQGPVRLDIKKAYPSTGEAPA